eukprot:CAMPEP_0196750040 /NCGR_PEP_ID=MMETSP1091-20130531/79245_1 /TAXON_ID=302021 /ORGANISM="Rhodomonas sp., Strain CCMP768" /LENGTH=42 /DNA_ID= /DNA_START= /DNA_END= /DNA_ORIENTATION=
MPKVVTWTVFLVTFLVSASDLLPKALMPFFHALTEVTSSANC